MLSTVVNRTIVQESEGKPKRLLLLVEQQKFRPRIII